MPSASPIRPIASTHALFAAYFQFMLSSLEFPLPIRPIARIFSVDAIMAFSEFSSTLSRGVA
jgi:hypothetical protein